MRDLRLGAESPQLLKCANPHWNRPVPTYNAATRLRGLSAMHKRLLPLLVLFATIATARDKVENWIEVRSPHFVVATTANEKQARRIADQFERMRSLFHALFPKLKIDPSSPIIVIAVKDDKDFRALEPQAYLAKGSLRLGGLFLRAADKNYVLLHLEAQGEHPYSTVYHEYTHLLMSKAEWMPLWLNEGLAEFYQNTDIDETDARLGQPSVEDIQLLRQTSLLPLATLFTVDYNSPYYHEENKGSIFYAESWALTLEGHGGTVVPDGHLKWIERLPLTHVDKHRIFVHAGVNPNCSLNEQDPQDVIWKIYDDRDEGGHRQRHIVHGHHQHAQGPILKKNRTNLDTFAWYSGRLVIAVFDDDTLGGPLEFLEVRGQPYR